MKQLIPTSLDEYLAEHRESETVSGRVVEQSADSATVELGEGIRAACRLTANAASSGPSSQPASAPDLSSLTSMLQARWKGGAAAAAAPEPLRVGQIRSFRIAKIDVDHKTIEVALIP
jgi:small subunit ribosomal protein S1